jgi:hypothetical protein
MTRLVVLNAIGEKRRALRQRSPTTTESDTRRFESTDRQGTVG